MLREFTDRASDVSLVWQYLIGGFVAMATLVALLMVVSCVVG